LPPRRPAPFVAFLFLAALFASGCVEDRLDVDITTVVHGDGACTRRTVYRLERVSSHEEDSPLDIPRDQDPLTLLHRFPAGEPWVVQHDVQPGGHTVTLEGRFASPNDVDWDYWRGATAKAPPARNHLSFAMEGDVTTARYDYSETFLDPASPMEGVRLLSRLLLQKDNAFAAEVLRRLDGVPLRGPDVARAYRDVLAIPFAAEVSALANRPVYGPRERRDIEALGDRLTALSKELTDRVAALAPGLDGERTGEALDGVFEAMGEPVGREMSDAGFPLPTFGGDFARPRIHFHATLVMPAPIVRANTCANGDTAIWDFDGDDLYGRGFEMWATAGAGR
jgi:hypothetical protein